MKGPGQTAALGRERADAHLAAIVASAMDAIISIDSEQRIVLFNQAAEQMFGIRTEEALGNSINQLIPERNRAAHTRHVEAFGRTGVSIRRIGSLGKIRGLRANGEEFPMEASISQVEAKGQKLFTVILRDISERERLEKQILEASEQERQRFGRDLHDSLCGKLVGGALLSKTLIKSLKRKGLPEAAVAEELCQCIEASISETRAIARGLWPMGLSEAGLWGCLAGLAAEVQRRTGVECTLHRDAQVQIQDLFVAAHLFRIVQEAVNNAIRHGHARHVAIELTEEDGGISLAIRDDGTGLPSDGATKKGLGLMTMEYRARIIGGQVTLKPAENGGTMVLCVLPAGSICPAAVLRARPGPENPDDGSAWP